MITPQRPDALVRRPEPARVSRDRGGRRGGLRRQPFRFPVQLVHAPESTSSAATPARSRPARSGSATTITVVAIGPDARASSGSSRWDGDLDIAHAPMSVTLVAGRRDRHQPRRRAGAIGPIEVGRRFEAERRLDGRAAARSGARLSAQARDDARSRRKSIAARAERDRHGSRSPTARPLVFDRYADNRATGSFILIDPATNFTAGAGMIVDAASARRRAGDRRAARRSGSRWPRARRRPTPTPSRPSARALEEMLT